MKEEGVPDSNLVLFFLDELAEVDFDVIPVEVEQPLRMSVASAIHLNDWRTSGTLTSTSLHYGTRTTTLYLSHSIM